MSDRKITEKFSELRRRAQVYISAPQGDAPLLSQEAVKQLVHELDTYQVELELQNEDLRKAQQDLEKSHRRISDLYDFAPVGHLTINDTGFIVEANLTIADMLGFTRGALLKQPLSKFIKGADQDIHYSCRKKLLESKSPQSCELRMKKSDGSEFYAQLKNATLEDIDGTSGQFRLTIADISSQKSVEEALVKTKNEWEKTFDAIKDIITIQDPDMQILKANRATCEFFEMEYDEIVGQKCYELFGGIPEPCPGCPVFETIGSKASHTEVISHSSLNKSFLVTSSVLSSDTKGATSIVHVAKDITEQISNEEKIRQAQRMQAVGTLAGGIAHEFNNMLGVIMGCADMARDDVPKDSFARIQLDKVMKASYRTRDLVKQILTCSRKSQQKCMPMQLKPLIKETMKLIEASLPSSIDINIFVSDAPGTVLVDPTEVQQVLMNLCSNATWAMKEKGVITISMDNVSLVGDSFDLKGLLPVGDYIKLSFSDTGCGMSSETQHQIFDPFYTTKEVGQGTGMGLAIVRGIIESYQGTVTVESDIGRGTTFHLFFPQIEMEPSAELTETTDKNSGGSERILFVDDEEMYAEMGYEMVRRLGYKVDLKTNSRKALEVFKANPDNYDLVITDQIMPDLSGEELVNEIRSIRPKMPIILCTGYSTQMDEKKAKSFGINAFAYKPIVRKDIAKLIRKVLDA